MRIMPLYSCYTLADNEEEEEEDDMETEDRDSDEGENSCIITFDPSLPTSHAVSDASAFFLTDCLCLLSVFLAVRKLYVVSSLQPLWSCVDSDSCDGSTWVQTWKSFMAVQSTMTTAVRPFLCCHTQL